MILHINPFYTVAMICGVACILALLAGLVIIDWEMVYLRWRGRQIAKHREEPPEWADKNRWEQSK